eukprot:g4758.t1
MHKRWKQLLASALAWGRGADAANPCDAGRHSSIQVHHHGHETTCKAGAVCRVLDGQCSCFQRAPRAPAHAAATATVAATAAAAPAADKTPPAIRDCDTTTPVAVRNPQWQLCRARARDDVDGDVTMRLRYTVILTLPAAGEAAAPSYSYLCSACEYGRAAAAFRKAGSAALRDGDYTVIVSVCDHAGNCGQAQQEISVEVKQVS